MKFEGEDVPEKRLFLSNSPFLLYCLELLPNEFFFGSYFLVSPVL